MVEWAEYLARCPICGEAGKIIEQSDDQKTRISTKTLRCRYCRHPFESKKSQVEKYRPVKN